MENFKDLNLEVELHRDHASLSHLTITNELLKMVEKRQSDGPSLRHTIRLIGTDQTSDFKFREDGVLKFKGRVCVSMMMS